MSKPNLSELKKPLIILCVIIAAILIAIFALDWKSRSDYSKVDKEASRLISFMPQADGAEKVQSVGGISGKSNPYHSRGDGLINAWTYCGVDVNCPQSDKSTVVLMPRGGESDFLESLWKLSGYTSGEEVQCYKNNDGSTVCFCSRQNSQYHVNIVVESADPYHHGAPVQDDGVSEVVWKYVTASVKPALYR